MGAPAFDWIPTHAEKNARAVGNDELGNVFLILEDYTFWKATTAGTAAATNWTPMSRKELVIPFDASWYEIDGTALAAFGDATTNTPGVACDGSEGAGIRWNNAAAPDPIAKSIPVPRDLDGRYDITATVVAWKTGATEADATTFDVGVFFNTVGALYDADANAGGTTSAMTGDAATKTVQAVTVSIDGDDLADPGSARGSMTITIQPTDGTIDTDDVTIGCLILSYNETFDS
jgi:hypothetical protein